MAKNFWGNDKPGATTVDTLIGRQTEIHGDVRFSGGLHIDGKVVGKVVALNEKNATVSVSESGTVEGDVRAPTIVLNGQVAGDVHASEHIALGVSTRGALALLRAARIAAALRGSDFATPDDVKDLTQAVLAHRLLLTPEAALENVSAKSLVTQLLERTPVPK